MTLADKARRLRDAEKASSTFDFEAEKSWWLEQLEALYGTVSEWLQPLVTDGLLAIDRVPVKVREEHGEYVTYGLRLNFAKDESVLLHPKGTLIIGARGRVDMYRGGNIETAVVLLLGTDKANPKWWVRVGRQAIVPMTKEVFEQALESILPAEI